MLSIDKMEMDVEGSSAGLIKDMKSLINNPEFRYVRLLSLCYLIVLYCIYVFVNFQAILRHVK